MHHAPCTCILIGKVFRETAKKIFKKGKEMLSSVISGIELLKQLYNISQELKSNAENCKRLCLRTKVFEQLLLNLHNNQHLITPALHKPLELLVGVLKEIQEFAASYYRSGNLFKTVRRFVVNVAFRNDQASTIAELNARINDCALNLGIIQQFEHDKHQQVDLEGFRLQLETCCEEVFVQFSNMQNSSNQLKELITELRQDADGANAVFTQQLSILEKKLDAQQKVSREDLAQLHSALQQDSKEIMKSLNGLLSSVDLIKGNLGSLLEGQLQVAVLMEKILNSERLTQNDMVKRSAILDKLRITSTTGKIQFEDVVLGMGGFGEVRLGYYSEAKVAIKSIKGGKNKNDIEAIENELLLMNFLGMNPNILHAYGFWQDSQNQTLHIVLELSPFGSLAEILYNEIYPDFTIRLILGWLSDLALALEFINLKKVKHRDVKSENLLAFPDMKVKLCDFGLAKEHSSYKSSSSKSSSSGTTAFMAPEVMSRKGSSYASDIYSLAMTCYQMIMRRNPTMDKSSEEFVTIAMNKIQEEFPSDKVPQLERLRLLMSRCTELDPSSRPSTTHVAESLKEILSNLGGDPRRKATSEDRNYLQKIENITREVSDSRIYGKQENLNESPVSKETVASSAATANIRNQSLSEEKNELELRLRAQTKRTEDLEKENNNFLRKSQAAEPQSREINKLKSANIKISQQLTEENEQLKEEVLFLPWIYQSLFIS
jgi:serine/threonine protein kinase